MALDRDDLIRGLRQVVQKLLEQREPSGIRIVGGAALSLRYFERGTTDDIDAQIHPARAALAASLAVSGENGWPADWLNTNATMFIPFGTAEWEPLFDENDVGIWVASAETLPAMKMRASRPARDDDDIANQYRQLQSSTDAVTSWSPASDANGGLQVSAVYTT